jgi:hypothetical protein
MFRWVDARGVTIADVAQTVRMVGGRPVAVYVARVPGEQMEKPRFACAKRLVEEWLRVNKIAATPVAA